MPQTEDYVDAMNYIQERLNKLHESENHEQPSWKCDKCRGEDLCKTLIREALTLPIKDIKIDISEALFLFYQNTVIECLKQNKTIRNILFTHNESIYMDQGCTDIDAFQAKILTELDLDSLDCVFPLICSESTLNIFNDRVRAASTKHLCIYLHCKIQDLDFLAYNSYAQTFIVTQMSKPAKLFNILNKDMCHNRTLTNLGVCWQGFSLFSNNNTDDAVPGLYFLKYNRSLEQLYLHGSADNMDYQPLAESLMYNSTLIKLDIGNYLGVNLRKIIESLEYNSALKYLRIHTEADDFSDAVAHMLANNQTLETLDLEADMSSESQLRILTTLAHNSSLRVINLTSRISHTKKTKNNAQFLETLRYNATITEINVNNICLGSGNLELMFKVLKHHPSLTRFNVKLTERASAYHQQKVIDDLFAVNYKLLRTPIFSRMRNEIGEYLERNENQAKRFKKRLTQLAAESYVTIHQEWPRELIPDEINALLTTANSEHQFRITFNKFKELQEHAELVPIRSRKM